FCFFFFSSRRRHTRSYGDWSSDVCSSDLPVGGGGLLAGVALAVKSLRPQTKVIAVEANHVASFSAAIQAGKPVRIEMQPTLADGSEERRVGKECRSRGAAVVYKQEQTQPS